MARNLYTPEEDQFLRDHYPGLGKAECARRLGRPANSVAVRASKLGLKRVAWDAHLTLAVRSEVVRLYESGSLVTEVQEATGLSYHHVRHVLTEAGIEVDRARASEAVQGPRVRHLTPEEAELVALRWSELVGIVHIAQEVGVNPHVIERHVREHLPERDLNDVLQNAQPSQYTEGQIAEMVRQSVEDLRNAEDIAEDFGCSSGLVTLYVRRAGHDGRELQREKMRLGYLTGRLTVSHKSGWGISVPVSTPLQGTLKVRSRTEARRVGHLNTLGLAWFYELRRYGLPTGSTYLPDFWLTEVPVAQAALELGSTPTKKEILAWLVKTPHWIEDVKGWFQPKERSWKKIHRFVAEYPNKPFSVVVMDGKNPRRVFGQVPELLECPNVSQRASACCLASPPA